MIEFTVPGPVTGKGRPRFARRGEFVSTYTPKKTVRYESLVKIKAHEAMSGKTIFEGAVFVQLDVFVKPPKSWTKKKKDQAISGEIYPLIKPDPDNIQKVVFDGMNGIVFLDDKQIVDVRYSKRYANMAIVVVRVTQL